jgi:hypothetical protein
MTTDQHAWNRGGVWDAYFAVVLAATLLIVLTTTGSVAARAVAAGAIVAIAPPYLAAGVRQARRLGPDRRRDHGDRAGEIPPPGR